MKLALGLATTAAVLIPTAVSAETLHMIIVDNDAVMPGSVIRAEVICSEIINTEVYACTSTQTTILSHSTLTDEQVADLATYYRTNNGEVHVFDVPSGHNY